MAAEGPLGCCYGVGGGQFPAHSGESEGGHSPNGAGLEVKPWMDGTWT